MSASASGTIEEPGRRVKQKSGLNKAILDQGWYQFRQLLIYKQEWMGGSVVMVPPQYTSQKFQVTLPAQGISWSLILIILTGVAFAVPALYWMWKEVG